MGAVSMHDEDHGVPVSITVSVCPDIHHEDSSFCSGSEQQNKEAKKKEQENKKLKKEKSKSFTPKPNSMSPELKAEVASSRSQSFSAASSKTSKRRC